MSDAPRKTPVTLENLLKLKRVETPPKAFWQEFEREMHMKQLAAIVEPRPWWAPLIRISSKVARYQLPVGAMAVLALSFIAVRQYQPPRPIMVDAVLSADLPATASFENLPSAAVDQAVPSAIANAEEKPTRVAAAPSRQSVAVDLAPQAASAPEVHSLAPEASLFAGSIAQQALEGSPTARVIEANLELARANPDEFIRLAGRIAGLAHAMGASASYVKVVDPLVQVQVPSQNYRTARLLASALPASDYQSDSRSIEMDKRLGRRLNNEHFSNNGGRFGLQADSVAIRF